MAIFGVIGPGAVGSVIGESLHNSGYQVTFLGRRAGKVCIERAGMQETVAFPVEAISEVKTVFDYLFITVKGTQLEGIMPYLDKLTHENTVCILCQNGYGQLEKFHIPNAYQAVVYISGQKKENVVTHFRDRILILPENTVTKKLKEIIAASNLEIRLSPDYRFEVWYKLIVNVAINSVTALSRNTALILQEKTVQNLCERLIQEGVGIAAAEGIYFQGNIADEIMNIYAGYPPHMGTSMYYDRVDGKTMETAYIQGYLYEKSKKHGLDTPCLDTVYSLLLASEMKG
ncbi:oxidoreductase [Oceanobacillus jeddahense]|uniref:2-dehydropantoate 2-reductase n=1 Tax=Oceanobacillus jeddahense TaxID=1462527 RepID=A0ABY5JW98_9BACI|nr:oxidoreductase [Oceanobacillus jeddahense]UUI02844.1 oxidoreductase [Oceanobacillus jeddahense]